MRELELLVELLDRERSLLDVLVYRLVELRALLVSGDGRYLAWAAEEVADATDAVMAAELHRALLVAQLADAQGTLDESLTLTVIIDTAEQPWRALLAEHRSALVTLTGEVADHASAVRRLSRTSADSVAALLDRVAAGEQERTVPA